MFTALEATKTQDPFTCHLDIATIEGGSQGKRQRQADRQAGVGGDGRIGTEHMIFISNLL